MTVNSIAGLNNEKFDENEYLAEDQSGLPHPGIF
jgi:hypothetical protein